jgi:hypothetical protein
MKDRLLLPLALLLLRALTPVGARGCAMLMLNRLVDLDLAAEDAKTGGWGPAGNTEVTSEPVSSYHTT